MERLRTKEKHGMTKTPIYRVWADMKNRCYNENLEYYSDYGGRGISVCDSWFYSFIEFYNDMGAEYRDGLLIDRIDVNGNYCKENCRWLSVSKSNTNKTKRTAMNRTGKKFLSRISVDGKTYYIGSFNTLEEAKFAYDSVRMEWYGI